MTKWICDKCGKDIEAIKVKMDVCVTHKTFCLECFAKLQRLAQKWLDHNPNNGSRWQHIDRRFGLDEFQWLDYCDLSKDGVKSIAPFAEVDANTHKIEEHIEVMKKEGFWT